MVGKGKTESKARLLRVLDCRMWTHFRGVLFLFVLCFFFSRQVWLMEMLSKS